MSLLGNIIWIIFGGLFGALGWLISGALLCVTVIGIPFGLQCFKLAGLQLAPFGKEVKDTGTGAMGCIGNVLWLIFFGWELALGNAIMGVIFAITIVGLPFAKQSFKLAHLSLFPFGKEVE